MIGNEYSTTYHLFLVLVFMTYLITLIPFYMIKKDTNPASKVPCLPSTYLHTRWSRVLYVLLMASLASALKLSADRWFGDNARIVFTAILILMLFIILLWDNGPITFSLENEAARLTKESFFLVAIAMMIFLGVFFTDFVYQYQMLINTIFVLTHVTVCLIIWFGRDNLCRSSTGQNDTNDSNSYGHGDGELSIGIIAGIMTFLQLFMYFYN